MLGGIGSAIAGAVGVGGGGGGGGMMAALRRKMQMQGGVPQGGAPAPNVAMQAGGMVAPQTDGRTAVPRPTTTPSGYTPNGYNQAAPNGGAYNVYQAGNPANSEVALDQYTQGMGQIGSQASNEGYTRTRDFDPNAAISRYAGGAWDQAVKGQGGLNDQLMRLREGAAGSGRLDSGFFDEDQGGVVRSVANDYQDKIAQTAVQGAQMQQQNNAALYGIGANANDQYTSGLTARIQERRDKAARSRQRKAGIGSAIGGIIGGVGGFALGGPAGAGIGYKLGAGIGGAAGS